MVNVRGATFISVIYSDINLLNNTEIHLDFYTEVEFIEQFEKLFFLIISLLFLFFKSCVTFLPDTGYDP